MIQRLWTDLDTRLQLFVGLFVWLFSLVVYCLTMAPTFSFWDCGEFITCSYLLAIPHPPGTPLYIVIGRLFSLLPFFDDIAVRINFLSALTSSLAALFGYLTVVRLLRQWFAEKRDALTHLLIHAGAASGAFFMAFGFTVWNNAVEAEVYGMTTLIMMAMIWLTILYAERRGTVRADQLMYLVFFLAFVGTGVHMTSFLVLPVVGLLFVIRHPAPTKIWYALAMYMVFEIYLIFALSARPDELPVYLPLLLVGCCYLLYYFSLDEVTPLMSILLGGFALCALPAIVKGLASFGMIAAASAQSGSSLMDTLEKVSMVSFAALMIFSFWMLTSWVTLRRTKENADRTHLIPASFGIAALLLVILLLLPKGYGVFALMTLASTIALAAVVRRYVNWTLLVGLVGGATLILGVKEFAVGAGAALLLILALGFLFKRPGWKKGLIVIALAVLGFSINGYSYIRSQQDPAINQNNPGASITNLVNFIDRKQYGSESMVERMFHRRAEWGNQFGTHQRMGYWGFFQEQYGITGSRFLILFLLGMFGIWELIRKTPINGLPFMLITLIASVGLILYMNFADGTRINPTSGMDYLEVRDRDYFFTPAFVMFGLAIGAGITLVIGTVRQLLVKQEREIRNSVIAVLSIAFLLPGFALAGNYFESDRSRNYIPWDYGFNLLSSAEPNGVMFTNGDNDTFPLWCMQHVYGVRTDVGVINLSLANSHWYMHQIQNTIGVNLGIAPDKIDSLRPGYLPNGVLLRNYDYVINAVYIQNFGKRPLYFSTTTGGDVRKIWGTPIDTMIELEGMMWRIVKPGKEYRVNIPYSYDYYTDTTRFRTRGVADETVYKDENTSRMVRNYANGFLAVADTLQRSGRSDSALALTLLALKTVPQSTEALSYLGRLYLARGDIAELSSLVDTTRYGDRLYLGTLLANLHVKRRELGEAEANLLAILDASPSYRFAFDGLVTLYAQSGQYTKANKLVEDWLRINPNDREIAALWRSIQEAGRGSGGTTPPESSGQ